MRLGRRLTFRRPKGSGALPLLALHVERARGVAIARAVEGRTRLAIPSTTGPGSRPAERAAELEERRAARELLDRWTTTFGAPTVERPPVPPADRRGALRIEHPTADQRSVDVVVCVHDALMDVHRCLQSLLEKASMPFRLIVVDDGSGDETTEYLRRFLARNPAAELIRNRSKRHGYTIAANLGLRESRGEYVVLLNSDTIVTAGWLEGLVECAEGDERVGIVGPLSNAASHQSVPQAHENGDWAVNPLPHWLTEDGMALVLAGLPGEDRVAVPFLNGFCYVIRRRTIEAVGLLDEETFGQGYSEENDYSRRAAAAGFELAVAPRSYVFHAKSRSYGHEERKVIAKAQYRKFLAKHGEAEVRALVEGLEGDATLAAIRDRAQRAISAPGAALELLPRLRVMFVVPGLSAGGSGGSHSIYQEVSAMRSVGIEAGIAVREEAWQHALAAYPDAETLFTPFADEAALAEICRTSDVVVATHHLAAPWVERLAQSSPDMLPAYYVQDYEPFFTASGGEEEAEVRRSYSAVRGQVVFAKTRWLCDSVSAAEGVAVHKVEPSLDRAVYRPGPPRDPKRPIRVVAMLRPRTPRRAPVMTLSVLHRLSQEVGAKVEIETFGCPTTALDALGGLPEGAHHHGILSRESVAEALRCADVFVDCSWYQAFGRTALEAMACGATALVPRLGGADEFAVHDVNSVVVDALDEEAIVDALLTLVSDRVRLGRLQETAAQTAADYSTVRAALSEYVLFQRAYAERAARPEGNGRATGSLRG
jgi:GT2 family glycosyltransferase/antirestriction protein